MTDTHRAFVGNIPENYDRYLRPLLFEPYAHDLARRLEVRPGMRVLELACGTGILTRHLRGKLDAGARLTATDLNQAMLECARKRLGSDAAEWRQADATALPFANGSFDAVVCQFGWMFFPDKAQAAREARRVLVSGGMLLFNTWNSLEQNELARIVRDAMAKALGSPPSFFETPYGMHDPARIRRDLEAGRFSAITVERLSLEGSSPSAADVASGWVDGSPVRNEFADRGDKVIDQVRDAVRSAIRQRFGGEPISTKLSALVCSAVAG
jgi:ubiquinone/menaquinone biosynthesis C-methylase UbiE